MSTHPHIATKAYMDQYRQALSQQRKAFDSEKALWDIERADLLETKGIQSPSNSSSHRHIATKAYTHHYKQVIYDQRHAFDSERVLWNVERADLLETIAALEIQLRQHQPSRFDPSGLGDYPGGPNWKNPTTSSGNEVWRGTGGQSTVPPTRVPLDWNSNRRGSSDFGTSGIASDYDTSGFFPPLPPGRSLSERRSLSNLSHSPSRLGANAQNQFDGIIFKSPPKIMQGGYSSKTAAAPSQTFSPTHPSSRERLKLPPLKEEPDNLTRHAGHTPLPRMVPGLDGTTSVIDSDLPTPSHTVQQRPPMEPRASVAKIPSERSNSYFPEPADEYDQDPELQGQLSLKNDASEDTDFLSELDSKLAQAAKSSPSTKSRTNTKRRGPPMEDEDVFDQPEPEPKLRIKRSLNFGSQLGGNFGPQP